MGSNWLKLVLLAAALCAPLGARATGPIASDQITVSADGATEGRSIAPGGVQPQGAASDAWRARIGQARQRYEAFAARAYERYLLFSGARERRTTAPLNGERGFSAVLNDPTLRKNDIYVSEDGFLVFHGRSGPPYAPEDFRPMPRDRASALSLKVELRQE